MSERLLPAGLPAYARNGLPFLPAGVVVVLWLALLPASGGFFPRDWMPAGLLTLGVLSAVILGGGRILPPSRAIQVALGAFAAVVAWNFLSIAWSDARGTTWESANQLLTYLAATWVLALAPWTGRSAERLFLAFSAGAALLCALALIGGLRAEDLSPYFSEGRWSDPVGHPGALAALAVVTATLSLAIAARPGLGPAGQALALGSGTLLACFGLLAQPPGAIAAVLLAAVVLVAAVPWRWRLLGRLAIAALAVLLAADPVLEVLTSDSESPVVSPLVEDAASAIALATVIAIAAGGLLGLLERRIAIAPETEARVRRMRSRALAVAGVVAVGLLAVNAGAATDEISSQWRALVAPAGDTAQADAERRRLRGEGGRGVLPTASTSPFERRDYWRVATGAFGDAPVGGLGAGAFEQRYSAEKRFPRPSRHPHQVLLRLLAENGIVGLALVLVLLGGLGATLLRGLRHASEEVRGPAAAALAAFAGFVAIAVFDPVEEFPAIAGPVIAFAFAAAVARVRDERSDVVAQGDLLARPRWVVPARAGGVAVVTVLCVASLVPQWLSVRWRERAVESWPRDAAAAYADLDRATSADPWSIDALITEGSIALRLRDFDRSRAAFEDALARQDHWFPHFQLALLDAHAGDARAAMRQLIRAEALAAEDPGIDLLRKQVQLGRRPEPIRFNQELYDTPLFKPRKLS